MSMRSAGTGSAEWHLPKEAVHTTLPPLADLAALKLKYGLGLTFG